MKSTSHVLKTDLDSSQTIKTEPSYQRSRESIAFSPPTRCIRGSCVRRRQNQHPLPSWEGCGTSRAGVNSTRYHDHGRRKACMNGCMSCSLIITSLLCCTFHSQSCSYGILHLEPLPREPLPREPSSCELSPRELFPRGPFSREPLAPSGSLQSPLPIQPPTERHRPTQRARFKLDIYDTNSLGPARSGLGVWCFGRDWCGAFVADLGESLQERLEK